MSNAVKKDHAHGQGTAHIPHVNTWVWGGGGVKWRFGGLGGGGEAGDKLLLSKFSTQMPRLMYVCSYTVYYTYTYAHGLRIKISGKGNE
jgi:hypothetical protein